MAERWLAMHAGNNQRYGNNASSMTSGGSHRQSLTTGLHDSAHDESANDENRQSPPNSAHKSGTRLMDQLPSIEASPGRSDRAFRSGNERLYEAYNDLHALAQDFEKPFDAPAILVVGHQTDGKSGALLLLCS